MYEHLHALGNLRLLPDFGEVALCISIKCGMKMFYKIISLLLSWAFRLMVMT